MDPKCINAFISQSRIIHKDKYNYDLVDTLDDKCQIRCKLHGIFELPYNIHLTGTGCAKCIYQKKFIRDVKFIFNDYYNYNDVIYHNKFSKIIVKCPRHGPFEIIPEDHLRGHGCFNCQAMFDLIDMAKKKYIGRYSYKPEISKDDKIVITCRIHGDFELSMSKHLEGYECIECAFQDFIRQSTKVHNKKYEYKDYQQKDKILISCPIKNILGKIHGYFKVDEQLHLLGMGCEICRDLELIDFKSIENDLKRIYGDLNFEYIKIDWINGSFQLIVQCRYHGIFYQDYKEALKDLKCPICYTSDDVIKPLKLIQIECLIHGSHIRPQKQREMGCIECYRERSILKINPF